MADTFVVVFPSIFTQNKLDSLISNIKNVLKIQNQKFSKIQKDGHLIIIEANDPVFASSAINLLYGIEQVAIARQIKNEFNTIVSSIAKIGTNLLLKGEKFLVKVEGHSSGFLPKDVEISAISALIEKTVNLGAKPGSEEKYPGVENLPCPDLLCDHLPAGKLDGVHLRKRFPYVLNTTGSTRRFRAAPPGATGKGSVGELW